MRNNSALAEKDICATPPRVGRKMEFPDKCIAPLPEGSFARIDRVLREGETRTDLLRTAVEAELKRREKP